MLSGLPDSWLVPTASDTAEFQKGAKLDTPKSFRLLLVHISQMHVEFKAMDMEGKA